MNIERILQLADVIEKTPHKPIYYHGNSPAPLTEFNMERWHCGTIGCIAGWTVHLFGNKGASAEDDAGMKAGELLGLSLNDADNLFCPGSGREGPRLSEIKPAKAALILRHLAATGEVNWQIEP
ncbi:MAG: hypothetical protein EOS65_02465 [Mesorhizobium sp.]|uniref:hypothetical protein n=1 Tax=Mesorhizobium sp. TaxID=1871066 RepID=UPI000FEA2961|nr:hypothetical protein [Mesorhizobium sp.]RWF44259.1 MAG: hypothetical protein EOS65_02465 [Mesorhizobium sp.]